MKGEQLKFLNDLKEVGYWKPVELKSVYSMELCKALDNGVKPSKYINKKLSWLFDEYIFKRYKKALLYAVDKSNEWAYSQTSYYRRSFRRNSYSIKVILQIIKDFHNRIIVDADIEDILCLNIPNDNIEKMKNSIDNSIVSEVICYELDNNNEKVEKYIVDIINGESDIPLNRSIIRGIIQSSNTKMYEVLGRLLVAARLQEGLRQVICELADLGMVQAFIYIINVIYENNLIRFSSIKRAIGTWLGLINTETDKVERISDKSIDHIIYTLESIEHIDEYLHTEDSMKIYIALWAMAVIDVDNAIDKVKELSISGTHHQILVTGYFCNNLDNEKLSNELSKQVIINHIEEYDILAIYMNNFVAGWRYHKVYLQRYFKDEEEASIYYDLLLDLYNNIPKKELVFSPCVFPWYTAKLNKSAIISKLCVMATLLNCDEKIDEVSSLISECDSDIRAACVNFTLSDPRTKIQKRTVTSLLADKESYTRKKAKTIVESMEIEEENYLQMEEMLRYKNSDIRSSIIKFLLTQEDKKLLESIERLLSDKKEEKRIAALDIIMNIQDVNLANKAIPLINTIKNPSLNEQILIKNILKCETETHQMYDEKNKYIPSIEENDFIKKSQRVFSEFFPKTGCEEAIEDCNSLYKLFIQHIEDEFIGFGGNVYTIGTASNTFREVQQDGSYDIPYLKIWQKWYKDNVNDNKRLLRMYFILMSSDIEANYENEVKPYVIDVFGKGFEQSIDYENKPKLILILERLVDIYVSKEEWIYLSSALGYYYLTSVKEEDVLIESPSPKTNNCSVYLESHLIAQHQFSEILYHLQCTSSEFFNEIFPLVVSVANKTFKREAKRDSNNDHYYMMYERYRVITPSYHFRYGKTFTRPSVEDYIVASFNKLISKQSMYEYLFREENIQETLNVLSLCASAIKEGEKQISVRGSHYLWTSSRKETLLSNITRKVSDKDIEKLFEFIEDVYEEVINYVLEIELNRGDSETEFSKYIKSIERIYGIDNFISILISLGKDKLERSTYYSNESKKGCLSHLLSVCIPNEEDNSTRLKQLIKGKGISEQRLIEAALYSPEWLDIIGEFLGWKGFKSGCYYFMAHMNERFDDVKKAIIAKYTPLSEDELNQGAFDINWFKSAYETLGKDHFDVIYKCAKYISDGSKHSRARKYADAVLGNINIDEAEKLICDKRNKDLLMAYSLIPLQDEEDISRRYLFLQNFQKESKQFGSQRIASEKIAVEIALSNLAMNAGFSDSIRLTLNMETKLIDDIKDLFTEKVLGDVTLKLNVNEEGKAEIIVDKNGKKLKSIPAKLKKDEYVVLLTNTKKKLTEQFKRTKIMFEQSMEDEVKFTSNEISMLSNNPVASKIVKDLLFKHDKYIGFISNNKLVDYSGKVISLKKEDVVVVAHPYHIYKDGHLADYQRLLFDKKIKQSFKQIFRELYVKTEEELPMSFSRRYSGNQIQVRKTIQCLKGRRWVTNVSDGLQKIYYKENIIATIYAMADWFTAADIEAPTLEYVEFYNRKDGKSIKISEVPDVIFSEVMRDVDMAVSVAHAGGIDPETSHSTIEMRQALIKFTLPLFKLNNVKLNKNHVIINGHYGTYTINLGSGVIHKQGATMVNVIPVHSQHRGKIFLPFADEDPKTAEIISKVIMFAEDKKIKDPSILEQIKF